MIESYFEDTDLDILISSVERYKEQDSYASDPLLTEEAWQTLLDIMEEAGELPDRVPFDDLVDVDIAKKAMNEGG